MYGLRQMRGCFVSSFLFAALVLRASRASADAARGEPSGSPAAESPAPAAEGAPRPSNPPEGAAPPTAPPTRDLGASLGLRAGWAFPMGALEKGDPLRSNFSGMAPVWLDAGYRLSESFYVGAYFQWAAIFVSDQVCPKNLSCSANDLRFGVNVHWHFKSLIRQGDWGGKFDPWVGLGAGYESTIVHLETKADARSQETNHGFELGNLQIGGDYLTAPWRVGAFVSLTLAQYTRRTHSVPTGSEGFAIADPALHLWFFLGLRGQYDL